MEATPCDAVVVVDDATPRAVTDTTPPSEAELRAELALVYAHLKAASDAKLDALARGDSNGYIATADRIVAALQVHDALRDKCWPRTGPYPRFSDHGGVSAFITDLRAARAACIADGLACLAAAVRALCGPLLGQLPPPVAVLATEIVSQTRLDMIDCECVMLWELLGNLLPCAALCFVSEGLALEHKGASYALLRTALTAAHGWGNATLHKLQRATTRVLLNRAAAPWGAKATTVAASVFATVKWLLEWREALLYGAKHDVFGADAWEWTEVVQGGAAVVRLFMSRRHWFAADSIARTIQELTAPLSTARILACEFDAVSSCVALAAERVEIRNAILEELGSSVRLPEPTRYVGTFPTLRFTSPSSAVASPSAAAAAVA